MARVAQFALVFLLSYKSWFVTENSRSGPYRHTISILSDFEITIAQSWYTTTMSHVLPAQTIRYLKFIFFFSFWIFLFLFRVDLTEEVFGRRSKSRGWPQIVPSPHQGNITTNLDYLLNQSMRPCYSYQSCKDLTVIQREWVTMRYLSQAFYGETSTTLLDGNRATNKTINATKFNHHTPSMP